MISIVLITLDRLHLLRQCIENVVLRTSKTQQVIIWDNGSKDGTVDYLSTLNDPRFKIIFNEKNIGVNAYAEACRFVDQDYIIELDDDVIDAPFGWDEQLLSALRKLPNMGYLASNIVDDGKSIASDIFFRTQKHGFRPRPPENGVDLIDGSIGGYCTITPRRIYEEVGGFPQHKQLFFHEDREYHDAVKRKGYDAAILAGLRVFHASGPAYSNPTSANQAKQAFYDRRNKDRGRKLAVKQLLETFPGVRWANQHLGLWEPVQQPPNKKK